MLTKKFRFHQGIADGFSVMRFQIQEFLGVDQNAQYIAIGIVIFIAISLDIRKYVARK